MKPTSFNLYATIMKWSLETEKIHMTIMWASTRQNLSSGFPKERDTNQSAQPQRLARKLKFHS